MVSDVSDYWNWSIFFFFFFLFFLPGQCHQRRQQRLYVYRAFSQSAISQSAKGGHSYCVFSRLAGSHCHRMLLARVTFWHTCFDHCDGFCDSYVVQRHLVEEFG